MSGINFGDYIFTEPETLPASGSSWFPGEAGLYAIVVYDPLCRPRPYRPIYFGESHGVYDRATGDHENYLSWVAEAGILTTLYRALCPLPGWTRVQRQQAESALILRYNPACNERLSAAVGLFGRRTL